MGNNKEIVQTINAVVDPEKIVKPINVIVDTKVIYVFGSYANGEQKFSF